MKGKFEKIGILSLVLVLALGALGVGFAQWTETLNVGGSASTGSLQLGLTSRGCNDNETGPDVGTISCAQTGGGPGYDYTEYTITVSNAYPGYVGWCCFDIENIGTIPAKVCVPGTYAPQLPMWADVDIDSVLNLGVLPMVLNPGDFYSNRCVTVTINDEGAGINGVLVPCQENSCFSFVITIKAIQWNASCL